GRGASQISWGTPPPKVSSFISLLFTKNPIQRLSGAQKGFAAPVVPARDTDVRSSRRRRYNCERPSLASATKTIFRPSGEIAKLDTVSVPNDVPSGGWMSNWIAWKSAGATRKYNVPNASVETRRMPANAEMNQSRRAGWAAPRGGANACSAPASAI